MKYVYCLVTNANKYYTEDLNREYAVSSNICEATVRNDPDDFLLGRREMESYGYKLVIMTDREYFLARLRGG